MDTRPQLPHEKNRQRHTHDPPTEPNPPGSLAIAPHLQIPIAPTRAPPPPPLLCHPPPCPNGPPRAPEDEPHSDRNPDDVPGHSAPARVARVEETVGVEALRGARDVGEREVEGEDQDQDGEVEEGRGGGAREDYFEEREEGVEGVLGDLRGLVGGFGGWGY